SLPPASGGTVRVNRGRRRYRRKRANCESSKTSTSTGSKRTDARPWTSGTGGLSTMRINTNIDAMNAQRNLNVSGMAYAKSIEKLSSGLRINRAADDAAGLSISEQLRSQVRGVNQAIRNAQDGISMIQTAEGALNEVHAIIQRMRELSVQAGNDTLSAADRVAIGDELVQLRDEINGIAARTNFNGKALLDGSLATA